MRSSAEKVKGGLLVDSREGLREGGDTGPAVVPGKPDESLLITAIRYQDDSLQMPPKTKLPDAVIADFEKWVKMGAPDPRGGKTASATAAPAGADIEKGRQHWAFQPPRAVSPPRVTDTAWPRSDIDRFLLAALEAKGLKPVADAGRNALIRRVSFDLAGLPPSPEEVEAFVADTADDAFATVVDRLLASPRFGERWGRHWLDVARFAESSGNANMMYPHAWRYRDWVIAAFNDDLPYDQLVKRQIAGDLLPARTDRERAEHLIATGFLAIGSKIHNTQNRAQFVLDLADEQIDVASQAFLGLTIACARCHDHKFDPISQRDYYALSGVFQSTQTCYGTLPGMVQNLNPSPLIELSARAGQPSALPRLTPDRRAALETALADLVKARHALTGDDLGTPKVFQTLTRLAIVRFRLESFKPDGTPRTYAMGARERFEPLDSPLYIRGELDQPGELVPRGFVKILSQKSSRAITTGSGRRELAEQLAARDNPLTARVMVNRIWLHLFGRGLVPTPDNFGAAGQSPSHPELLDSLAVWFMKDWSVKNLIRRIVLSRAYQLGSTHDTHCFEVDPDNTLIWRMSPKRLEAEALRDAVLATSGKLDLKPPVGSAVARAGEGPAGPMPRVQQRRSGHAPGGLPDGRPRPVARVSGPVRLRRPEPDHRRALDDQRTDAGTLLDEQPVRDPPGRGRRQPPVRGQERRRRSDRGRLSACSWPDHRPRPSAIGLATSSPIFSPETPPGKPAATDLGRPGRRSARPSMPAPSSDISIDDRAPPPIPSTRWLYDHVSIRQFPVAPGALEGPFLGIRLCRLRRAVDAGRGRRS